MKILITGGFGFIGSNLIKGLLQENHDITIIDNLSSGKEIINKDIVFYKLDVQDKKIEQIFKDTMFDIVIHLAFIGYSGSTFSNNGKDLYENNIGLINILYLSEKYNVKRIIILSSFKVYGEKKLTQFSESDCTLPSSLEGHSYLSREILTKQYKEIGLNVLILRVGAVYGPGQYGTDIEFIENNRENPGDFIYIDDLCKVFIKAMENYSDTILNISSGEGASSIMDSSRTRYFLNWYPKYTFKKGLAIVENSLNKEKGHLEIEEIEDIHSNKLNKKRNVLSKEIEVAILFLITFFLNNLIRYKLGIDIDLNVIYIVIISITYGLRFGLTAVLLSIISYIWFYFNYEEKSVLMFMNDIGSILYITLYFVLGITIGYMVEEQKRNKENLYEEISLMNEELEFIKLLYNKSQEVKLNLQYTIESYRNNLTRTNKMLDKLLSASKSSIFDEITYIYSKYFHANNVILYKLRDDNKFLEIITYKGDIKYNGALYIKDYSFLSTVIKYKSFFVNNELNINYPTIAIPINYGEILIGIAFLDNIEFSYLNQNYLNNLKVTTNIISKIAYKTLNERY